MPKKGYKQTEAHKLKLIKNLKMFQIGNIPHNKVGNISKSDRRRYYKNHSLKKKFGITIEDFENMVSSQGSRCAICGSYTANLQVDHNHVTGEIRGLLCLQCNMGLGLFKDNPQALKNAIDYLRLGSRNSDDKD